MKVLTQTCEFFVVQNGEDCRFLRDGCEAIIYAGVAAETDDGDLRCAGVSGDARNGILYELDHGVPLPSDRRVDQEYYV